MEEFYTPQYAQQPIVKDLNFYRQVTYSIELLGGAPIQHAYCANMLSMSPDQLGYCNAFYLNTYRRPLRGEELMFADGFCEMIRSSSSSISPDELLLNDEYIASTYARLMAERHRLEPEYTSHASIERIFSIATEAINKESPVKFPYSEIGIFSSYSDEAARLSCIAGGCLPLTTAKNVCIGKKRTVKENNDFLFAAVVYADPDQNREALFNFLSLDTVVHSTAKILPCKTRDIFPILIEKYEGFSIDTTTLPIPRSGKYANYIPQYGDISTVEAANAFLTDELFGESSILIFGDKRTLKKLCSLARKNTLSSFCGIRASGRTKKASVVSPSPVILTIKSSLYRILSELGNNIRVKIPSHSTDALISDCIPTSERVYKEGNDTVFSATFSPATLSRPFHGGIYSVLSPLISAAADGANLRNGELTLSVSASLPFNTERTAGCSLSALLGLFRAQTELSLPLVNSDLQISDGERSEITVTVHSFTDSPELLSLGAGSPENLLISTADADGLPDFSMLKRLISGEKE